MTSQHFNFQCTQEFHLSQKEKRNFQNMTQLQGGCKRENEIAVDTLNRDERAIFKV